MAPPRKLCCRRGGQVDFVSRRRLWVWPQAGRFPYLWRLPTPFQQMRNLQIGKKKEQWFVFKILLCFKGGQICSALSWEFQHMAGWLLGFGGGDARVPWSGLTFELIAGKQRESKVVGLFRILTLCRCYEDYFVLLDYPPTSIFLIATSLNTFPTVW